MGQTESFRESRRGFMRNALAFGIALPSIAIAANACSAQRAQLKPGTIVGGPCDGCSGIFEGMPRVLTAQTTIASEFEPGERMEIAGTIYRQDGKTPATDTILYLYHTDVTGLYTPAPGATGITRRHGHLRGWVKTASNGEYRFLTIKPAPYPNRAIPAHVHPIVKEPDKNEYYLDEYVFDDDPLLTAEERSRRESRGGSGICRLVKNSDGVWICRRDLILGLNIPNYA